MTRTRPSFRLSRVCTALIASAMILPAIAPAEEAADSDEAGSNYVEYMVGISHSPDSDLDGANSSSIQFSGKTEQKPIGYFVGGAAGRYVAEDVRVELQIGFRNSEINQMSVQGEPSGSKNATLSMLSVMANAYYDFDLRDRDVPVVPWVGLGIGWGMPRIDGRNQSGPNQLKIDDTASTMVYNFMGGVTWPFSKQAELVGGYRYLASIRFDLIGTQSGLQQRFKYKYQAHEAYTGIRFRF